MACEQSWFHALGAWGVEGFAEGVADAMMVIDRWKNASLIIALLFWFLSR
jgi:hypothetical protein